MRDRVRVRYFRSTGVPRRVDSRARKSIRWMCCWGSESMTAVGLVGRLGSMLSVAFLCGCVTLTAEPRAVLSGTGDAAGVMRLSCDAAMRGLRDEVAAGSAGALDRGPFRVLIWNIHKQGDPGWQGDLASFAAGNDVMLLQETVLDPPLRSIVDSAGLRWVMASSFLYDESDIGVLTATRVPPVASCTQRVLEPLLRIPKSAVISWLRIAGTRQTLAVVNVHAINFDLFVDQYRAQLDALVDTLAVHQGPIVFAGDFNTWSDARDRVLGEIAARLGMTELELRVDKRATFFGRHVDHMFVRGVEIVDAIAIPVTSSDHNPVQATLRIQ
jgi:endonuclease/exonuclease/phosphatase (EEP) superfamily protein YafD